LKAIFFALWNFRHFITSSIHGELKRRFARSKLGAFWFIHPLMQAAIFTIVIRGFGFKLPGVTNKAAMPST
jgi:lipopolysaccharide transport system permease protein